MRDIFNCLGTFILKVITPGSGVISENVGYGLILVAQLLRRKGVQLGNGAEIHSHAYLFRTTIKGMKKTGSKKAPSTIEQCISSNAPLTLFKRKRIHKHVVVVTNSEESSADREPLIK